MKVLNEYHHPNAVVPTPGHHYIEEWGKTTLFCPNCGKQEVWSGGGADYYQGSTYICTACAHSNCLDFNGPVTDQNYLDIIKQLQIGIMSVPTTPSGR